MASYIQNSSILVSERGDSRKKFLNSGRACILKKTPDGFLKYYKLILGFESPGSSSVKSYSMRFDPHDMQEPLSAPFSVSHVKLTLFSISGP